MNIYNVFHFELPEIYNVFDIVISDATVWQNSNSVHII